MLTKRKKQILDYIKKQIKQHDYSPSLEELAKHFKLAISTIHQHIDELKRDGYLDKLDNQPRTIQISENKKSPDLVEIPLLGLIAAGQPIEAIENPEVITVPKSYLTKSGKHYALRVEGNSMIDEGIFDGDTVVIREQPTAENGETVVAIIDENQATLKKLYREKDRFRLQPANQELLPLYKKEVEVKGIVVQIIRSFKSQLEETNLFIKILNDSPITRNVKRLANSYAKEAKPFLQWVGGKREIINQCKKIVPKKFKTYYEPFIGGGAMFFYLQPNKAILGDNNLELIKAYNGIKNRPQKIIRLLKELKMKHSKNLYMKIRNLDRIINIFKELNDAEIAARMIYLNQTGFNGLYRVNKKSQFNVPIGSSLNRLICDKNTIQKASKVLKNAIIKHGDFEKILQEAKRNDFAYLDPPYFPVSKYSDFTRYTKEKFYIEDQKRLKKTIDKLTKRGVKIMLSNSNCKFIKNLYSNYKIHEVSSNRSLNCKKDKRGKVLELLITNY